MEDQQQEAANGNEGMREPLNTGLNTEIRFRQTPVDLLRLNAGTLKSREPACALGIPNTHAGFSGTPGRIRTFGLRFRKPHCYVRNQRRGNDLQMIDYASCTVA